MASIIGGPHDGGFTISACPGQIGLVLPLSPRRVDPEPGHAGAYYQWRGDHWRFVAWASADADWELLFWEPKPGLPERVMRVLIGGE